MFDLFDTNSMYVWFLNKDQEWWNVDNTQIQDFDEAFKEISKNLIQVIDKLCKL